MENCSDKNLVEGLRENDVKSFDAIYLKYYRSLYTNIFKLVKDPVATQDLLQEVFISLWEKRATIDKDKLVANWLFTVSYNKTINYLRQTLRASTKLADFKEIADLIEEKDPGSREIQLYQIENAVKNLSPQKSRVFDLCKVQGKTYDETAREMNISRHTVKEYLVDAMVSIKDYIKQHPESATAFICAGLLFLSI